MAKNKIIRCFLKLLLVILSASVFAFFFKVIVEGRGFLAMGGNGVALILSRLLGIVIKKESLESIFYMIIYLLINIPLFIFSYKKISVKFTFYTMLYIVVYSLVVGFIPESMVSTLGFNELDNLTSAVLIGLINGVSSACVLFVGGCSGGLSIISTYLNVKRGKTIGIYNLIFNVIILSVGYIVFRDMSSIIYTLVYAFFSSLILDKYYNRNKKILLEIITSKKEEVCGYLLNNSHHGCTIVNAQGAYTGEDKFMIHAVISWFQLKSMTKAIKEIDNHCFIIDLNVYDVKGAFYTPPIK